MSQQRFSPAAAAAALVTCALAAACSGGSFQPAPPTSERLQSTSTTSSGTSYSKTILADRPVQYFQLSESSGATAADSSVYQKSGTYSSCCIQYASAGASSQAPYAVAMDAGAYDAGVRVPAPAVSSGGSYTFETWVRPRLARSYMTIWGYSASRRLLVASNGQLLTQFAGTFWSKASLSNNAWHYVALVYNAPAKTLQYYIDGALDSSLAVTGGGALPSGGYMLGEYDTSGYYKWHGSIAQHAVYAVALSASQISQHYHAAGYPLSPATPLPTSAPTPQPESPCVGYRWSVKTASDSAASSISTSPVSTTIVYLTGVPQPNTNNTMARMAPAEDTTYQLTNVTLSKIFKARDNDYHLLLTDGSGHTMIAEVPDTSCAPNSRFASQISAVRKSLNAHYPNIGTSDMTVNATVTLRGVGYFDYDPNYAEDQAPDGIELHPVTSLCFGTGCSPGG